MKILNVILNYFLSYDWIVLINEVITVMDTISIEPLINLKKKS